MSSGFDIARSGLIANERALSVTAHNISNLNTKGYVRQQAMITEGPAEKTAFGAVGLGAQIEQVRQLRNQFIDGIYRMENCNLGMWDSKNKVYTDIENILGEPMNDGLQKSMTEFWDSWQELSKNPESLAVRSSVRQRTEAFTQKVNLIGTQLSKIQSDLNSELTYKIKEINEITTQVAELNKKIGGAEVTEDAANDFRDQRNVLLDKLHSYLNITSNEDFDGQVDVIVNGEYLVYKGVQQSLESRTTSETGTFFVPAMKGTERVVEIKSGLIKGLMQCRGEVMGTTGSIENGMPNIKADVTFAIDTSDTSAEYLSKIKGNISSYIDDLEKRGLDYNLKLVTFGTSAGEIQEFGTNTGQFMEAINSSNTNYLDSNNNLQSLVEKITSDSYRPDANRYTVVFTGESINGNGESAVTSTTEWEKALKDAGIKMSVTTNTNYFETGDSEVNETVGWGSITKATGGNLYDLNSINYVDLMKKISGDTTLDVNAEMCNFEDTEDVVPNISRKINALVNSVMREINYLHMNGRTRGVDSKMGEAIFVPINNAYPLQMGNIKLNDNLMDLDNLVSSQSDMTGDNTIAIKIANIRNESILKDKKGFINSDEYFESFILYIGNKSLESSTAYKNQLELVNSADSFRNSIMSVSLDEEMSNMLKYKFAYAASSKSIQVMDSMLEMLIKIGQ